MLSLAGLAAFAAGCGTRVIDVSGQDADIDGNIEPGVAGGDRPREQVPATGQSCVVPTPLDSSILCFDCGRTGAPPTYQACLRCGTYEALSQQPSTFCAICEWTDIPGKPCKRCFDRSSTGREITQEDCFILRPEVLTRR